MPLPPFLNMNCVLEGNCVKAFGKAIHALSRIGEELWLDPTAKGLALRAVNSSHSAYACFLFSPLFFHQYSLGAGSESGGETVKCKLLMKSVLPLFRCLTSIERNVKRCQISVTPSDRVVIQVFCRHGITKTYNLGFQESEPLQAVFASHLCANVLKAPARLLSDMVMHFPVSQEEITLSMTPQRVSLRNYFEGGNDHMKKMFTEMSLHPDEFDLYQVGVDSDITFGLKEFRGLLCFAETHSLPVSVHFGAAGKPVCFSVEDMVLEATVVLATLIDPESRSSSQHAKISTPTMSRGTDVSSRPVGSCGVHTNKNQEGLDVTVVVPSSQGSPITTSPLRMELLPQLESPVGLCVHGEDSVGASPASSVICSLLFRALSSQQGEDGRPDRLSVLACYSDEEENMEEEDYQKSPSL